MGKGLRYTFSKEDTQWANKHMKRWSVSLTNREMQIKTIMRFHLVPIRMAIIKKKKAENKGWWRYGEIGTLVYCWWECKNGALWGKTVWQFLKILKMGLPYKPAIPVLGIWPKDLNAGTWEDSCTPMFVAALFTMVKRWKLPKCQLIN